MTITNCHTDGNARLIRFIKTALALIAVGSLAFAFGCEGSDSPNESDVDSFFDAHPFLSDPRGRTTNPLKVSPRTATVEAVGQKVLISASGGATPYTWDVASSANGTVDSSSNWRQAIYTATTLNVNSVIVYDRKGNAAIATIRPATGQALEITASPDTLELDGDTAVLDGTGGAPPYTWTVGDTTRGTISSTTGNSIVYTRTSAGNNSVTLVDQNGTVANVVIIQP